VSRPARFSQQARREIDKALREMEHVAAQQALRAALETTARRLGGNPYLGRPAPPPVPTRYRFWSLTRFGYVLVYDPQTDPVEILRFVHTKRDLPRALADLANRED
jgi:plasmid stabilization system protein ParE